MHTAYRQNTSVSVCGMPAPRLSLGADTFSPGKPIFMDSREGVHQRWRNMEGIKGMLPLRQGWLHPLVRKICTRMEIERIFFSSWLTDGVVIPSSQMWCAFSLLPWVPVLVPSMTGISGVKKHREKMNEKVPRAIWLTTFKRPLISYITQNHLLCLGLAKPL